MQQPIRVRVCHADPLIAVGVQAEQAEQAGQPGLPGLLGPRLAFAA